MRRRTFFLNPLTLPASQNPTAAAPQVVAKRRDHSLVKIVDAEDGGTVLVGHHAKVLGVYVAEREDDRQVERPSRRSRGSRAGRCLGKKS